MNTLLKATLVLVACFTLAGCWEKSSDESTPSTTEEMGANADMQSEEAATATDEQGADQQEEPTESEAQPE